ncbi:MAG TPA: heme biosynthesis protein HemY, partial [Variovorax sp.]|nr:heme biosynthesis protein HemY [Variovorax sp.]
VRAWGSLENAERAMPDVAIQAAHCMTMLGGDLSVARAWLLPVWERAVLPPSVSEASPDDPLRARLVRTLEAGLDSVDHEWLARIEAAHRDNPRDPMLQYLAGIACLKRELWGKAQQLLTQAARSLQDPGLLRHAWQALARLAETRGDEVQAAEAWRQAAGVDGH